MSTLVAEGMLETNACSEFKPLTTRADEVFHLEESAIARVAYKLWEERGRPEGSPEVDWFEAERQLDSLSADLSWVENSDRT